jgi:hypothetical protein
MGFSCLRRFMPAGSRSTNTGVVPARVGVSGVVTTVGLVGVGVGVQPGPTQPLGELSHRFRPPPPPQKKKKKKNTLINQGPKIIKKKAYRASIDSGGVSL